MVVSRVLHQIRQGFWGLEWPKDPCLKSSSQSECTQKKRMHPTKYRIYHQKYSNTYTQYTSTLASAEKEEIARNFSEKQSPQNTSVTELVTWQNKLNKIILFFEPIKSRITIKIKLSKHQYHQGQIQLERGRKGMGPFN